MTLHNYCLQFVVEIRLNDILQVMILIQNTSQCMDTDVSTRLDTGNFTQCNSVPSFLSLTCITFGGFVISVVLNTVIICAIKESSALREIEAFLYQMLAVWDIFTSFVNLLTTASLLVISQFCVNQTVYIVTALLLVFTIYQTLYIVLTIHICRYVMIVRPLQYLTFVTRRNICISQIAWFLMSAIIILTLVFLKGVSGKHPSWATIVFPMIVGFVIQLVTSTQIMYTSIKQSRLIHAAQGNMVRGRPGEVDNPARDLFRGNSFKGVRTIIVITVSYWIVWCPWVLFLLARVTRLNLPPSFRMFSAVTSVLNTSWNPVIHYVTNQTCRLAVNNIFRRMKNKYLPRFG